MAPRKKKLAEGSDTNATVAVRAELAEVEAAIEQVFGDNYGLAVRLFERRQALMRAIPILDELPF